MGWRAYSRWFVWPAILLWVVLWKVGPFPIHCRLLASRPEYAHLGLLVFAPVGLSYLVLFGVLFGLLLGRPRRRLRRVIVRTTPLALLAGLLDGLLRFPEGLQDPSALMGSRVWAEMTTICLTGGVHALLFLASMGLGAHVARHSAGRHALGVAGVIAAALIAVVSLAEWSLIPPH